MDECIEELERKEKQSKDFRNSLDFLKNSLILFSLFLDNLLIIALEI